MTQQTIDIVKSTAPVIKEHGEAITSAMYPILFEKYPQTKELFANSDKDQYKKLANAVYAYAANIDKLENLGSGIETMALAHVKTKVQPEHYPMVGDAVLTAIKQVLGDAATDEIINAWKEAFFFLADVLIKRETQLYTADTTAV
ncbi:MAG: globin domain-containing protein [Thiovulaceae bacterium]|nr:globin domain-containing protein [Sulfurimonadaceae bacterium]